MIDPVGLAVLLRARRRARSRDGVLCLVEPPPFVVTMLRTVQLDQAFPTFAGRSSALAWLRERDRWPAQGTSARLGPG
jgi:anti-anti-sigma regulatory factor